MAKIAQDVISIIRSGQNVIVPSSYTTSDLILMAKSLGPGQQMTIRKANVKMTSDLIQIARSSSIGQITFDLSE